VAEQAAAAGAHVITQALDQPRNIHSKGSIGDIVTGAWPRGGGGE